MSLVNTFRGFAVGGGIFAVAFRVASDSDEPFAFLSLVKYISGRRGGAAEEEKWRKERGFASEAGE